MAMLGLAACSGGPSGETSHGGNSESPTTQAGGSGGLAEFDPCSFLTSEDLNAAGVVGPGEAREQFKDEPGCGFEGEKTLLTLYKNQKQTVDSYKNNGQWDSYDSIGLNGRKAARGVAAGATGQGACSLVVDAGGGVVIVDVVGITRDSVPDTCGEAEKVARQIEPRLPK
ncbi:DUF3558 family protein [Saccharopolyspora hattusasensis]|uniref:DUF3558 family protein n=1 Tax=Saccharopolyspora hattusasensis TaxID=1128679 RepID=UPI003D988A23